MAVGPCLTVTALLVPIISPCLASLVRSSRTLFSRFWHLLASIPTSGLLISWWRLILLAIERVFRKKRLSETMVKVRNVIFLVYMEDLEAAGKNYYDLLAYLDSLHCKAVVSPVHDRDLWTGQDVLDWCTRHEDPLTGDVSERYLDSAPYVGKAKKPHVHVGICSKTQRNAEEWSDFMGGLLHVRPSMFEKMEDYEGFARYCAHLDSPDKAKYNAMDIISIAGADLSCLMKDTESDRVRTLTEMYNFIQELKIKSFADLFEFAMGCGDLDMISSLRANGAILNSYFNSKRCKEAEKRRRRNVEK